MTTFSDFRRQRAGERESDPLSAAEPFGGHLDDLIIPESVRGLQGHVAGFTSRVIASFIDVLAISLVVVAVWGLLELLFLVLDPTDFIQPPRLQLIALGGFPLMWIYWTIAWSTSGRTLGGTLLGLKVTTTKGHTLAWPVAALRSVFCVVFPIGDLWILVSRQQESVQDLVLRTKVIYHWQRGTAGRD